MFLVACVDVFFIIIKRFNLSLQHKILTSLKLHPSHTCMTKQEGNCCEKCVPASENSSMMFLSLHQHVALSASDIFTVFY